MITKKILAILITALIASCTQHEVTEHSEIKADSILLDVRTEEEYQTGHLDKAVNIPYTEISGKIRHYQKNKNAKIVVYCKSGRRAGIAKKALESMGYTNVTNAGGYEQLKQ